MSVLNVQTSHNVKCRK